MHAGGIGFGFFTSLGVQDLGLVGVPFFWLRPLGVNRLGHYLLDHWEESMAVHNTTVIVWDGLCFYWGHFFGWKPYMLALVGQPSSMVINPVWFFGIKGALWRNCRLKKCKTSFSLSWVFFCIVGTL